MQAFNRIRVRNYGVALALTLTVVTSALAGKVSSAVRIDNFGKINANYYRGAQPDTQGFADLAKLGIKTVIDLQADGQAGEKTIVERAGMKFYRIPMTTSDRPSQAAVTEFIRLVNDPANQPVFVHCKGGRHRTGVMTAVYRMNQDGWNADQSYQEMKRYHFETLLGHPQLKSFVYDYYTQNKTGIADTAAKRAAEAVAAAAPVTAK